MDQVFFPSIYGPSAKRAGHKSKGEKRGSVTYSTDRENEVSNIFIISLLCLMGLRTISIHAEQLKISEEPRKQVNLKLFDTQFRVKESLNSFELLGAIKVRTLGDKPQNSFATFNFGGP